MNQKLKQLLYIEKVISETEMRFEPRTLVDLSGQVASKYRNDDLKSLLPQVKKCLLTKIVQDYSCWFADALEQDQLVQNSIVIRRLLNGDNTNLPLGYEQYILVRKGQALYELEWGVCIAQVFKPDRMCLSLAIQNIHLGLTFLADLLNRWYRHWQFIKTAKPEEVPRLLVNANKRASKFEDE